MIVYDFVLEYLGQHKIKLFFYFIINLLYLPLEIFIFSVLFSRLFVALRNTRKIKLSKTDPTLNLLVLISVLYAVSNVAKLIKTKLENRILPGLIDYARSNMFSSILQKMKKNYKDLKIGDIISRFIMIPSSLKNIIQEIMSVFFPRILTLFVMCGLGFYLDVGFGGILSGFFVIILLIFRNRFKTCNEIFVKRNRVFIKNNQDIQDRFLNLFNIFLSNQVELETADNQNREKNYKDIFVGSMKCIQRGKILNNIVLVIMLVSAFYYLIFHSNIGRKNVSKIIACLIILGYFVRLVDQIQDHISIYLQNSSCIEESKQFFDEIFSGDKLEGQQFEMAGNINIKNVSFKYNNKSKNALYNINANIKSGNMVLVKGKSGSGKSTLVKLITGFYRVSEGELLIDGNNVNDFDIEYLRDNIGYMTQHLTLFDKTIMENILYGNNQNLSEDYVLDFIKNNNINIYNTISEGLNKEVGPSGNNISGGQKQMTLILRLLLSDKKILILDEPTTALDDKSFNTFVKLIKNIENRTIIIISHDVRFKKKDFNKVFKIDNGILTKEV